MVGVVEDGDGEEEELAAVLAVVVRASSCSVRVGWRVKDLEKERLRRRRLSRMGEVVGRTGCIVVGGLLCSGCCSCSGVELVARLGFKKLNRPLYTAADGWEQYRNRPQCSGVSLDSRHGWMIGACPD